MEEKTKILEMLAAGKINVQEAEKLLTAIGADDGENSKTTGRKSPKFLRVEVKGREGKEGRDTVNVRVPFSLLRAGVKLAALIPQNVQGQVTQALGEKGIHIDLSKMKPDDLEEVITQLEDLQVDVDSSSGDQVRVYVE